MLTKAVPPSCVRPLHDYRGTGPSGMYRSVSARRELDKVKAIAKRVGQVRYPPILAFLAFSIERCAAFQSSGNSLVKIRDDEIEVN